MCQRKGAKKGVNLRGTSTHVNSTKANGLVYLDISTIRKAGDTKVRNGVWVALVCEFSGFATSLFVSSKHAMIESVCELLSD